MHPLHQHINKHVALGENDFKRVLRLFHGIEVKKGYRLIDQGTIVKHQHFVLNGCLRTYMVDADGKEHTIQFAIENWWVSDYISYYKNIPSVLIVECLEDSELLKIHVDDLHQLFEELPQVERFFRKQLENAFVAFQMRILSSLHLTAEKRYDLFVKNYPDLGQRVKNYQIASYLGITPESLSRLRKQRIASEQ
ncbi:Crp/Fnr family transcriptional regulator [Flavobacteriaceae bacterium TP-CH-4]|uniref:Crp/Fnr family transcriptional regulator n=1 Tax=Pelagihabitans pacificus TaxID=2696054 RepID=A0A967E5T6_9FLAO|nr:Crp/Fnr family transcriptional regulator [Pelagihabitans pacificus]NHF58444.1 Crp/Fnr family transcriptional regulator [Pelagihabitans pacificus]